MTQAPSPVAFERHIRLDGPGNFRDLGGYAVAGGSQVRRRTVFRSDGLETLSPRDRQLLVDELGIGVVIDLRSPKEAEQYGTFPLEDGLARTVSPAGSRRAAVRSLDDLLTAALDANLTLVSLQQNEDMRRISAWVAIAELPTMIAGIYGMNFEHMPELHWYVGYPLSLGVMGISAFLLYRMFKRRGWV